MDFMLSRGRQACLPLLLIMIITGTLICSGCDRSSHDRSANQGAAGSQETADNTSTAQGDTGSQGNDPISSAESGRLTLLFGGDVMLDRNVAKVVTSLGNGDYTFPWLKISDEFKAADIAFVNLESPITDKGVLNSLKPAPWFRASPQAVKGLQYAGIDIVSVANNHAFDYNRAGFEDSLSRLKDAGIRYTGGGFTHAEAYCPLYITAKGTKVAFLGYMNVNPAVCYSWSATEPYTLAGVSYKGSSGIAWLSEKALQKGISQAMADNADLIVVSMHFGSEYETVPSEDQEKYARYAMEQGADIVVGHHPHVTQPTVIYSGGHICYSLGNLIFDQIESNHAGVTHGKVLEVRWENDGIAEVSERPVRIDEGSWQPSFE